MFFLVIALGCYWAVLIYQLGAQWSVFEQYNYGWGVPFLCVYLLWQRWPSRPGAKAAPFSLPGAVLIGALLLLLFPIRVLHEANPIWRVSSIGWALILVTLTLGFVWRVGGWAWVRHFGPAVGFFFVAVPWPTPLETAVTQGLMRLNVGVTVEILHLLGIPALQRGNVVELATGLLGIEEACSGIRSLQATFMISLFFWILYRLSWRRGGGLVVSGAVLSFCFNVIWTSLLSWVAASQGMAAISSWHDPAGVTVLVWCFLLLWFLAMVLAGVLSFGRSGGEPVFRCFGEPVFRSGGGAGGRCFGEPVFRCFGKPVFRWGGVFLLGWLVVVEGGDGGVVSGA